MTKKYDGVLYNKNSKNVALWQLNKAEKIISASEEKNTISSVNEAIELYNIVNLITEGIFPEGYDMAKIEAMKKVIKPYKKMYAAFFADIDDKNILDIYSDLWFQYKKAFWELFDHLKVYERISQDAIDNLLCNDEASIDYILQYQNIVKIYDGVISDHIRKSAKAISVIIDYFFGDKDEKIYLPKSLAPDEYDGLFMGYIASNDVSIKHLELLSVAKNQNGCKFSDKMRLAAKRAYDEFWQKNKGRCVISDVGLKVQFISQKELCTASHEGRDNIFSYDINWLEENLDELVILNNFIYVFHQVDSAYRSRFPSYCTEMDVIEYAMKQKGKGMYLTGINFSGKHKLYDIQIHMYYNLLEKKGIKLENVFKWFFMEYLPSEYDVKDFIFNTPSDGDSWLNKYKSLVSEVDAIFKQYDMYFEDGTIDRELFEMSSTPVRISQLRSCLKDRYAYPVGSKLSKEIRALFSDQSCLSYTEKTKDRYSTMHKLLISDEKMTISDFNAFQQDEIKWCIERGSICINDEGYLYPNKDRCFLLNEIYKCGVLCPRYCQEAQSIIDCLYKTGELEYSDSLFSRQEQEYFNYVMNKSEYVNGLDLRNKYSHGTYSLNDESQYHDYIQLLKIMIMIITKINEEFIIRSDMNT